MLAMMPAALLSNAPRVLIGVPLGRVSARNAAYHSALLDDAVVRRSAPPGRQGELRRLAAAHVDRGRGQDARDLLHLAHEHARIVPGPYGSQGIPAFQGWHVWPALYECGSTVPMAFGACPVTAR